jgi:ribosomal protein S27E
MIHFFAAGAAAVKRALERECPTCGLKQTVPTDKLKETVPCTKCGALLPPKEA